MLLLIAGITGFLGHRLATSALTQGLSVRGLTRHPSNLSPALTPRLESLIQCTSYADHPALKAAVTGVDAILCAYTTDPILYLEGSLSLLRAAETTGVKIFVAASWTQDWTGLKPGDFELYDSILALARHVRMTSQIRPVFLVNGTFAEWTMRSRGGLSRGLGVGHDGDEDVVRCEYWGDGDTKKISFTTMDDAAAYTIEILCTNEAVRAGHGGVFRFRSGEMTLREMAAVYERVTGGRGRVEMVRMGSLEEGERALFEAQEKGGPGAYWERLLLASRVATARGLWEFKGPVMDLSEVRRPTTYEEHLRERMEEV